MELSLQPHRLRFPCLEIPLSARSGSPNFLRRCSWSKIVGTVSVVGRCYFLKWFGDWTEGFIETKPSQFAIASAASFTTVSVAPKHATAKPDVLLEPVPNRWNRKNLNIQVPSKLKGGALISFHKPATEIPVGLPNFEIVGQFASRTTLFHPRFLRSKPSACQDPVVPVKQQW